MGCEGLDQKGEDGAALQSKCLDHAQQSLDEAAAAFACTTERTLSPQHPLAEHTLGVIVGWLDVFFSHEHPESLAQRQQVLAEDRDRGVRAATPSFEKSIKLSNDGQEALNQLVA